MLSVNKLAGLYFASRAVGLSEVRDHYENILHGRQWSKIKKEIQHINELIRIDDSYSWYKQLCDELLFDK